VRLAREIVLELADTGVPAGVKIRDGRVVGHEQQAVWPELKLWFKSGQEIL
jgi:hypothetical protein